MHKKNLTAIAFEVSLINDTNNTYYFYLVKPPEDEGGGGGLLSSGPTSLEPTAAESPLKKVYFTITVNDASVQPATGFQVRTTSNYPKFKLNSPQKSLVCVKLLNTISADPIDRNNRPWSG